MRSSVFVLACLLGVVGVVAGLPVAQDQDDVALMELGVDLTHKVTPMPTYVTSRPAGHEDGLIAKFPLLHEIEGIEKDDWKDIQGLLFREPPSAAESTVDMKLDELEKKFNALATLPVPSSVAPPGSTLLPSLKKPEIGLFATLPDSLNPVKKSLIETVAPKAVKAAKAAAPVAAAKAVAAPAVAIAAAPAAPTAPAAPAAPAAAAAVAAPAKVAPAAAAPAATAPVATAKPLSVDEEKAHEAAQKAAARSVEATVGTVRLIEKRLTGLTSLVQRLKSQIGLKTAQKQDSASRLKDALHKHRKDKADLAKRMANRKTSLSEIASETSIVAEAEAGVDAEAEVESESSTENDAESEAELEADAAAVDEIIDQLM